MNPRLKAKKLVDKFLNQQISFPYRDSEDGQCIGSGYMNFKSAKQCALLCVEEIIEATSFTINNYWHQVKNEIEKL